MTELAGTSRPAGPTARLIFLRAFARIVVIVLRALRGQVAFGSWAFEREFLHAYAYYLDGLTDVPARVGTAA